MHTKCTVSNSTHNAFTVTRSIVAAKKYAHTNLHIKQHTLYSVLFYTSMRVVTTQVVYTINNCPATAAQVAHFVTAKTASKLRSSKNVKVSVYTTLAQIAANNKFVANLRNAAAECFNNAQ